MKLRCSKCRKTWIDAAVGRCSSCGLVLGADPDVPAAGGLEVDLDGDLNAEFDAVHTPPPDETDGPGWRPESLTSVTGTDSLRHHGTPERVPGVNMMGLNLTPFEGYLLSLVDGATFADDVVAASGLGRREAAVAVQNLKDKGLIRFKETAPKAAPAPILGLPPVAPKAAPAPRESPEEQLGLAAGARSRGEFARAREHARLAWMIAPEDPRTVALLEEMESPRHSKGRARLLHDLGNAAHHAGSYLAAVNHYRGALMEFEPSAVIHHKLAMVLVLAGVSFDEAEAHLLRAMELQPHNGVYVSNLARLREMKSQQG